MIAAGQQMMFFEKSLFGLVNLRSHDHAHRPHIFAPTMTPRLVVLRFKSSVGVVPSIRRKVRVWCAVSENPAICAASKATSPLMDHPVQKRPVESFATSIARFLSLYSSVIWCCAGDQFVSRARVQFDRSRLVDVTLQDQCGRSYRPKLRSEIGSVHDPKCEQTVEIQTDDAYRSTRRAGLRTSEHLR